MAITKPVNRYISCTTCKEDPQLSFKGPGGMIPMTPSKDSEKVGAFVVPAVVIEVEDQINTFKLVPGDVIYYASKFGLQQYAEGRITILVHEDHVCAVSRKADLEAAGVVVEPIDFSPEKHAEQFPPKMQLVGGAQSAAMAAAAGLALRQARGR